MIRNILIGVSLALALAAGVWISKYYYSRGEVESREQSQVLLEKVRDVAKLVTVEGYFSEIYDYKDYWAYDIGLFRKKALLRVKAKVSVGYDLGRMHIEARPEEKVISLSSLPGPQIISIDHDIDYYDISEGTFNSFTAEDYTRLNRNAKMYIEQKALESDLLAMAEEQSDQMLELIKFIVENAGWTLRIERGPPADLLDSLSN